MFFFTRIPSNTLYLPLLVVIQLFFWGVVFSLYNYSSNIDFEEYKITLFTIMIFMFCFQNLGLGMISGDYINRTSGQFLIIMKSIFVCCFLAYLIIVRGKLNLRIDYIGVVGTLFIIYCFVSFVLSNAPFLSKASNLRNFIMPVILLLLGRHLLFSISSTKKIITWLYYISILFCIVGLIEYFIIEDQFLFQLIGVKQVFLAKIGQELIPGTLYSNEAGIYIRRMISIFYDPLTTGFFFSIVFAYSLAIKKYTFLPLILFCLILTYHKAGLLLVIITGSYLIIQKMNIKFIRTSLVVMMFLTLFVTAYFYIMNYPSSAIAHLKGLYGGLSSAIVKPLGYGIGSGGYFSWMYGIVENSKEAYSLGADSGIGSMGRQIGALGLILYISWLGILINSLISYRKMIEKNKLVEIRLLNTSIGLLLSYLPLIFLTENIISLYSNYLIFIFAGVLLEKYKNFKVDTAVSQNAISLI